MLATYLIPVTLIALTFALFLREVRIEKARLATLTV